MHKGVILLVKATDKDEALDAVNEFMEPYGDGDVWDWFQIGGRWNNTLAPKEPLAQWHIVVDNKILKKKDGGWISQDDVDTNQSQLQTAWEDQGLKGNNPYCNHYKLGNDGNVYDVIPLSECIETVKEWVRDLKKEEQEMFDKLVEEREKEISGEKGAMPGYFAGRYKDISYGSFCFDSNVFDITEEIGEAIPDDVTVYYAVMVDMHN